MEIILIGLGAFFLFGCVVQLVFINWNLKEIIVLLCRLINHQEAVHPRPPRMPSHYNEP